MFMEILGLGCIYFQFYLLDMDKTTLQRVQLQ